MTTQLSLTSLGWQTFFQQQLNLEEWEQNKVARVFECHRNEIEVFAESGKIMLPILHSTPQLAVGDWILLASDNKILRVLDRLSCFRRKAAGSKISEQLIAANINTAFIVCSLNEDFNLNRIERYLSVVHDAGAVPVIVLSKADLCSNPDDLKSQVQKLDNLLCVEVLNCQDRESASVLLPWCKPGHTLVMLGSSGAGKSTLTNTLLGDDIQLTQAIRENDAKGRHTTTRRSLLPMPNGCLILDTPGMRELQLTDCVDGITATFSDIETLAEKCKFGDCHHQDEPGCAVKKAIESGDIEERRLRNYQKLLREQALNSASIAERRAKDKKLGRYYSKVQNEATKLKRE